MRFISRTGTAVAILLTLAAAFVVPAHAQGLGEITVDSAVNQPLRAHIELLNVAKLDASQVKAALATDAEFELARVELTPNLRQLKFQVEIQKDGTGRILVTSSDAISEPFLDLLVGVTWPNGRTLREYTVLLDLPPNNNAMASVARTSPAVAGSSTSQAANGSAAREYEVQAGDSLYRIAEQTRPSTSVGVQQMMLALQRANEDAFINNNINRIMTGKVLRIPRQDEITLIDQEAAVAQINQQNLALDAQPLAVNDSTGAKGAAARDELTLLSGDQDTGGGGSSDLDATIKALENQAMLSEENLDRSRLENLELTNRLSAVQEQIDLLQNIIAIEDERIGQLQKQLSSQSAATKAALANAESAARSGGDAGEGMLALLGNSVVLLGALLAVAAAVALMLFIKRRNAQAALDEDADISLDELADARDAEDQGGMRDLLASFMARFRRTPDDEGEEPVFAEEAVANAAVESAPVKPVAVQPTTDTLLDEMGLTDDFMSLQNALDDVEATSDNPAASHPNAVPSAAVAAIVPARDTAVEEAGAALEEAALLEQALSEAELEAEQEAKQEVEQEAEHEDFLQAVPEPAAPVPAVPEAFAFTAEPVAGEVEEPEVAPAEDKPEVFEFTLPSLDDLDTDASPTATEAETTQEKVETISFNLSALSRDSDDSLSVLDDEPSEIQAFDEDSITLEDGTGDESSDLSTPQDTHDARLDLAVAYEAMGDIEGAVEILEEVIASGKTAQVAEAQRLKQKWQHG